MAPTGLDPDYWTPRELRHSFVSLLSDNGMPLDKIALLVGHSGTQVTEKVYRQQIRPVIQDGAQAMDLIFPNHN
ncbi:tyrosine-type recombinase/integrase [Actinomadura yumaensis]|uniref:Tyrosine-type recombinase/integrase n=1 Tax=Actinomadura yumaensis TaxID=111807 RepID=A0ABW2CHE1_9ACTN|nr:tyrosine-type recombinase/integrase [Actinomadura sp. J1-007]